MYRAPFIEQGLDIGPSYLSTQKGCVREYTMLLSEDKKSWPQSALLTSKGTQYDRLLCEGCDLRALRSKVVACISFKQFIHFVVSLTYDRSIDSSQMSSPESAI